MVWMVYSKRQRQTCNKTDNTRLKTILQRCFCSRLIFKLYSCVYILYTCVFKLPICIMFCHCVFVSCLKHKLRYLISCKPIECSTSHTARCSLQHLGISRCRISVVLLVVRHGVQQISWVWAPLIVVRHRVTSCHDVILCDCDVESWRSEY